MLLPAPSFFRHLRRSLPAVVLLGAALLATAPQLHAQAQNTGELSGNVTDVSHALVPDALIVLTSEDRGNKLTVKSNSKGEYSFHDLTVGSYTLRVTATGFNAYESHHITIDADSRFRVDAELKTGVASDTVEVNADAVAVDTQSAVVQQVIDNELVENLPIDGNNVVALASLLPGVTDVSAPTTFTDENGGATFSASGARNNSNLFLFDGLLWNNLYLNTGINYPNHAVLQQVTVQLNNFSAQYGRNAGSIFNVVSKSGTNTTHGEVFLHYQDSMFDAKNYFSNTKPQQHTYQFGVAIGGPIVRDKLFYEAEFQALSGYQAVQANAETLSYAEEGLSPDGVTPLPCTAPKLAGKNCASFAGDAKSSALVQSLIVNPLFASPTTSFGSNPAVATSQLLSTAIAQGNTSSACIATLTSLGAGYLANAEIPSECFDPTAQQLITRGYIPHPDTKLGTSQYLYSSAQAAKPTSEYGGFLRLDYNLSARQQMAFRFYRTDNADVTANGGSNADTGVPTYGPDANSAYITAGSVSHTLVVTPNILNIATLGYKRYEYHVEPLDHTTLSTLGSTFAYPGFQSLPVVNINTRFTLGNSLNAYTHAVSENIELVDNVTWTRGRHSFQFGTDYLHNQYLNIRTNVGTFNFYGNPGFTNSQAADFIMGLVYSQNVGNTQTIAAIQNATYNYAQDTWRILPRLTLNLGVRYELPFVWYQPKGRSATFIRGYRSLKFPNAPADIAFVGDPGVPRGLVNTDLTNVSPRVGLAYDVFGNGMTAIRAGFGTFYDAIPATVVGLTQPYTYRSYYSDAPGSFTNPLYGQAPIPANYPGGSAAFPPPNSIIYPDAHFRNGYVMGFNFGIQQQVTKGSIVEVNYLGRLGRKLVAPEDQNPAIVDCSGSYYQANAVYCPTATNFSSPSSYTARVRYPGFNYGGQGVVALKSNTNASYHAGQIVYRQRAYRNLTMLANYTYSRTIDNISNLTTSNPFSEPDNVGFDRAASSQNSTHIFNMGWRLQLGTVRHGSGVVKQIANGWAFQGIYNIRSGHPFNVTFGGDELGTDEPGQRAYLIPGMSPTLPSNRHRIDKVNAWFNPAAFIKPTALTATNIGRNSLYGPAYTNIEFSMTKNIDMSHFRKGLRSQFRAEAFNVFNTINLGQPRASYSASAAQASTFASINSGGTNPNRRIQFGYIQYF